jgi:hypothetical protein
MSDEFCRRLNEDSHKHATLPEHQRYGVHFEYHDLVNRLNKLKNDLEKKSGAHSSRNLQNPNKVPPLSTSRTKKKSFTNIYNEKPIKNTSKIGLPSIKTPRAKVTPNFLLPTHSDSTLRLHRIQNLLKLHPLAKLQS